jgi:hypothetical protein
MHALGAPHIPLGPHVCTLVLSEHCVAPGEHDPAHFPPTQPWFAHGIVGPHCPFAPHVCTPLFEHCVVPAEHRPHTPGPLQ